MILRYKNLRLNLSYLCHQLTNLKSSDWSFSSIENIFRWIIERWFEHFKMYLNLWKIRNHASRCVKILNCLNTIRVYRSQRICRCFLGKNKKKTKWRIFDNLQKFWFGIFGYFKHVNFERKESVQLAPVTDRARDLL